MAGIVEARDPRLRRNYREKGSAVASDSQASLQGYPLDGGETPARAGQVPVMNSSGSRGIFRKYLRPATSFSFSLSLSLSLSPP